MVKYGHSEDQGMVSLEEGGCGGEGVQGIAHAQGQKKIM
jgi:hypothetical protein